MKFSKGVKRRCEAVLLSVYDTETRQWFRIHSNGVPFSPLKVGNRTIEFYKFFAHRANGLLSALFVIMTGNNEVLYV